MGVCGKTYQVLQHKIKSKNGERYWRRTSFRHKRWTEIPDLLFTPREKPLRKTEEEKHPRSKYNKRKLPKPRTMRCTDIEIPEEVPYRAFVDAWNELVDNPQILENHIPSNVLESYRLQELKKLIHQNGKIERFDNDLAMPVLELMVVNTDETITVHFLSGIQIKTTPT